MGRTTPREARLAAENERLREQVAGLRALLVAARAWRTCGTCGYPVVDESLPCDECDDLDPLAHLREDE